MSDAHVPQVSIGGTVAEAKRPMLVMGTRYDYMMAHLPTYKQYIRFRLYAVLSGVAGLWLLFNQPILSLPAFFLATYYYHLMKLQQHRSVGSHRTVMIGH